MAENIVMTEEQLKELTDKVAAKTLEAVKAQAPAPLPVDDKKVEEESHGFKGIGDFAQAVKNGSDARLKGLQTNTTGEYIIPPDYSTEIMKVGLNNAPLWSAARKYQTRGNSLEVPYRVDKNHTSGNVFGGADLYWEAEGAQHTNRSDLKFGQVSLKLKKIMGMVEASNEFIEDSPFNVDTEVRDVFGQLLGFKLNGDFINGNGAGKPLGILNSGACLTVSKDSGQAANTISVANLLNMYSKFFSRSGRGVWVITPAAMPLIAQLAIGNTPVWLPGNNIFNTPGGNILGLPVIWSEHASALSAKGDVMLVDPAEYFTLTKSGDTAKFDVSMHLYFDYDKQAFRITYRTDGQPGWETYLTLKNSFTQSPFLVLENR